MKTLYIVIIITLVFIVLDIITGVIKSFKEKNYTSSSMREGLFHKCGSILCILFGCLVDYTQKYVDIGVSIPITEIICIYIILMEIGSNIENICAINPDILPDKIKKYFKKLSE